MLLAVSVNEMVEHLSVCPVDQKQQQCAAGMLQPRCRQQILINISCWRHGVVVSGIRRMNNVNTRRARLVPGWVNIFGWVYHLGM